MKHNMRTPLSTEFYILWIGFGGGLPLASAVCIAYVQ